MTHCAAYGCTSRSTKKIPGITFHKFPASPILRKAWMIAVRRKDFVPLRSSVLCSEHFEESEFDRSSTIKVNLKPNAVPSIFKTHSVDKEKIRPCRKSPSKLPRKDAFQAQKQNKQTPLVVENSLPSSASSTNSAIKTLMFMKPFQIPEGNTIKTLPQTQQVALVVGNPLPLILSAPSVNFLPGQAVQRQTTCSTGEETTSQPAIQTQETASVSKNSLPRILSVSHVNSLPKTGVKRKSLLKTSEKNVIYTETQPQQTTLATENPLPLILSTNSILEKEVQMNSSSSISNKSNIQTETMFKQSEPTFKKKFPFNSSVTSVDSALEQLRKLTRLPRVAKVENLEIAKYLGYTESDVQNLLSVISSVSSSTDTPPENGPGEKPNLTVSKEDELAFQKKEIIEQCALTTQKSLASNALVLSTVSQLKKMLDEAQETIQKLRRKVKITQQAKRRQAIKIDKLKHQIEELTAHYGEEQSSSSSEDSDELTFNESAVSEIIPSEQNADSETSDSTQPMVIKLSSGV